MIKILILMLRIGLFACTVDVDLPEMKYLADHLKPEECRRLLAALHFKSYDLPNAAVDSAEGKVSEDISCLNHLLHWNSNLGEGRGETHEILFRRLHQIGRNDLAEWLGNTVFHELGQDLKRALKHPFAELITEENDESAPTTKTNPLPVSQHGHATWQPFDTVAWLIIALLILLTIILLMRSFNLNFKFRPCKRRCRRGKYQKMESQPVNSESESEDKFDIREAKKQDPALTLMGVEN